MTRRRALALSALSVLALTACEEDVQRRVGVRGTDAFDRYVAIGTSISAGFQSNGIYYAGQQNSWPSLLASQAFASFSSPLIEAPGCPPPIIAPLQFFRRLDASSLSGAPATPCTGLVEALEGDVPVNNVAVPGATANSALNTTYEETVSEGNPNGNPLYALILGQGNTQVTAALAQNPTLVSIELGSNEVLGAASSGRVVPGVTFVPAAVWQQDYDAIVEEVQATGARVLLVTVPRVTNIVAFRTGAELWAQRAAFQPLGVTISPDCNTTGANYLLFVPQRVVGALGLAAAGQPQTIVCTTPDGIQDFALSPAEVATLEAVVEEMNDHIASVAQANGFALVDANEVLDQIMANKPPFVVQRLRSCARPYGQFISLDGVHPANDGHRLIANAAAQALNEAYGFAIPQAPLVIENGSTICD